MTLKEKIYHHCLNVLNNKINTHRATLDDLKESASNETKSTAGDKHETALAMLQIEQKNTAAQLEHLLAQKLVIKRLLPVANDGQVTNGSLVKTNKGYFYLSIPIGKLIVDGTTVTALSAMSPLGSRLMGLAVDDSLTVPWQPRPSTTPQTTQNSSSKSFSTTPPSAL
jgi:transcription elongation GreA/GreB family factor